MNKAGERLINGLVKENPTFVLMLGMCPTLAVTTSAINGLGMGLTTMVVLTLSNLMISLLRKIIPNRVRQYRTSSHWRRRNGLRKVKIVYLNIRQT